MSQRTSISTMSTNTDVRAHPRSDSSSLRAECEPHIPKSRSASDTSDVAVDRDGVDGGEVEDEVVVFAAETGGGVAVVPASRVGVELRLVAALDRGRDLYRRSKQSETRPLMASFSLFCR